MPPLSPHRLLIIGWDAADWKMIDPLIAQGAMPNLQRLIERGVRANLASLDPKLSPILWTSIATGKTADRHGILNFIEPDPVNAGVRVVSSVSRQTKALWNVLTQSERRSLVVNWYATHPAEPIRGVCVSNLFQEGAPAKAKDPWPIPAQAVSPASLSREVESRRCRPSAVPLHELNSLIPKTDAVASDDRRIQLLRRLLAQCRSVHQVALSLLSSDCDWDCAMLFYDMIDVAGHHFMQYHPPRMAHVLKAEFAAFSGVMTGVYRMHDRLLGELLNAAGDETTVIVLSDHGFHSDHLRPPNSAAAHDEHAAMDATWHRETGMLVLSGPGVKPGASIHSAGLLDIAPTALTLLGLPSGNDMPGRPLMEALDGITEPERIASWDDVSGESGQHPADARVDSFQSLEALKQLADLGYIEPLGADMEKTLAGVDRESRSNLGVVYMTTGRPHLATPVFDALHADYPADARFATNFAHCLQATGHPQQALGALSQFLAANPSSPEARLLWTTVLASQGRHEEAAGALRQMIRERPNDARLLVALGDVHRVAGQWDQAAAAFAQAVRLDPGHAAAHHGLAQIALARRQFEPAAQHALDALQHQFSMTQAHFTLGSALAWMDELDDAIKCFQLAVSLQPGLIAAHRFIEHLARVTNAADLARHHGQEFERLMQSPGALADAIQQSLQDEFGPDRWLQSHERSNENQTSDRLR